MSDQDDLIPVSFELLLDDAAEAAGDAPGAVVELGLMEETNPLPPAPLKASVKPAEKKGAMSKDNALVDMEPTERKYELAKKGMDKSCRPYFGHGWRA